MKKILCGWILFILICPLAFAANFSGKWQVGKSSLILNQVGNYVEGEFVSDEMMDMSSRSAVRGVIHDAKVEGDTLTFYVWLGYDKPVKQFYRGTMVGDTIHVTIWGGFIPAFGDSMTATFQKSVQIIANRQR
jgi:hypothetical protein